MTKHCKFCKQDKNIDLFPKNRAMKDGHDGRCKDCWRIYSAQKRANGKIGVQAKFSKQPAVQSSGASRAAILSEDLTKIIGKVEVITISHLSKLPGDRKFLEWVGSLSDGLKLYKDHYGLPASLVYTYVGDFARHFIGR